MAVDIEKKRKTDRRVQQVGGFDVFYSREGSTKRTSKGFRGAFTIDTGDFKAVAIRGLNISLASALFPRSSCLDPLIQVIR